MFKLVNKSLELKEAKLDFGCGLNKENGYIGIDSRELAGVDIVSDTIGFSNMPSETAYIIRSCHFIEHLNFLEFLRVMTEWKRILMTGGQLLIFFPDLKKINPETDNKIALRHVFGGRDYKENCHNSFHEKDSVQWFMDYFGFENIQNVEYMGIHHPYKEPFKWTTGLRGIKND